MEFLPGLIGLLLVTTFAEVGNILRAVLVRDNGERERYVRYECRLRLWKRTERKTRTFGISGVVRIKTAISMSSCVSVARTLTCFKTTCFAPRVRYPRQRHPFISRHASWQSRIWRLALYCWTRCLQSPPSNPHLSHSFIRAFNLL